MKFNNSDQLRSFLKKEANRLGISITSAYKTYFARTFLENISKYVNDNRIICKGSSAELAYLGKMVRVITDIDLATIYNHREIISDLINSFSEHSNGIKFEMNAPIKQTNTGIYQFSILGCLDKTKQQIGMDFQENYSRLIEEQWRIVPPIFEGDKSFEVCLPSFEEFLAEKLCIILETNKPDVLNTRVKDFYDIYQLHGSNYDPDKFTEYFQKIIRLRNKITIEKADTTMFDKEFIEKHKEQWEIAVKKYEFLDKSVDLECAVYYSRGVAREQLQKAGQKTNEDISLVKKR